MFEKPTIKKLPSINFLYFYFFPRSQKLLKLKIQIPIQTFAEMYFHFWREFIIFRWGREIIFSLISIDTHKKSTQQEIKSRHEDGSLLYFDCCGFFLLGFLPIVIRRSPYFWERRLNRLYLAENLDILNILEDRRMTTRAEKNSGRSTGYSDREENVRGCFG